MKNYITVAALLAAGTAFANAYTVETDSSFYTNPNAWVYVWTGTGADNAWGTAGNWVTLRSLSASSTQAAANAPAGADPAFIGYDLSFDNGSQVLTSTDDALTISAPQWLDGGKRIYLGSNVTLSGGNNGFKDVTFNFGDFSGTSTISMGDFWKQNYTVSFAGDVTMTEGTFSYTLFSATNMYQNMGTWDASAVSVTDASGNKLTYTTEEDLIGTAGYYWLEETGAGEVDGSGNSPFKLTLHAAAIPEPSAFGLLAGLGALALVASRRRRR